MEREFCDESCVTFIPRTEETKESGTNIVASVVRPLGI